MAQPQQYGFDDDTAQWLAPHGFSLGDIQNMKKSGPASSPGTTGTPGGGAPGMGSSTSQTTSVPVTTGVTQMPAQTAGAGGWLANNYGLLATAGQFGLGAYQALQKPTYHQTPLSPEQSELYRRYIQAFDNPATKYNAGIVSDIGKSEIGRVAPTLPWNRTSATPMAYQGLTPPTLSPSGSPGGTNADYYQNLIRQSTGNQQAWMSGNGAPNAAGVAGPPGTPAGTGAPAGGGTQQAIGIAQWLSQHPEITQTGVQGIATAIASTYGIDPQVALAIATSYINSAKPAAGVGGGLGIGTGNVGGGGMNVTQP